MKWHWTTSEKMIGIQLLFQCFSNACCNNVLQCSCVSLSWPSIMSTKYVSLTDGAVVYMDGTLLWSEISTWTSLTHLAWDAIILVGANWTQTAILNITFQLFLTLWAEICSIMFSKLYKEWSVRERDDTRSQCAVSCSCLARLKSPRSAWVLW